MVNETTMTTTMTTSLTVESPLPTSLGIPVRRQAMLFDRTSMVKGDSSSTHYIDMEEIVETVRHRYKTYYYHGVYEGIAVYSTEKEDT